MTLLTRGRVQKALLRYCLGGRETTVNGSLQIRTFGGLTIECGGQIIGGFASRKAELLLVYLACNPRPHRREFLAELLWDDRTQRRALSNLRVVLSSLRNVAGPFVLITRDTASIDSEASIWLDAVELERVLALPVTTAACAAIAAALDLYCGDFLAGVHVRGARGLEEWMGRERERLHQLAVVSCQRVVEQEIALGRYTAAIARCGRLLELDPLLESAHRQLMQVYAVAGDRANALAQYQTCRQLLRDALGIEPAAETAALYEAIRDDALPHLGPSPAFTPPIPPVVSLPPFLTAPAATPPEAPVFVAREQELGWLRGRLEKAAAGHGGIAFIAGEAGMGKTALLHEFAQRAGAAFPDLLVATSRGSALGEAGDPYLPVRQLLGQLTGGVEAPLAAGHLTPGQAERLWRALPQAIEALLHHGPDLVNHLLSGPALLARAREAAGGGPWLEPLRARLRQESVLGETAALQDQVTVVLQTIAREHPLLLLLDDAQWADNATLALLFHLCQHLTTASILVVVAYRSEELAVGDGKLHPLLKLRHEAQRRSCEAELDLAQAISREGGDFIDALLDTEPNRLGAGFRAELLQHTDGHPFFTVELLRAMQARGDLLRDDEGHWVEGQRLDWQTLPAQLEAVIAERIGRLPPDLQRLLEVASVEGERFTVAVLARAQQVEERELLRQLSVELDRRYRLVRAEGWDETNGRRLARYRFRHALFSQYLYRRLDDLERTWLHEEIGLALESLYGEKSAFIAPQLARHFHQAQVVDKAVAYYLQAGDAASAIYAHDEAVEPYRQALALQKQSGSRDEAARTLLKLGLTYHQGFHYRRAQQAYDEAFLLWQRAASALPAPLPAAPHPLRLAPINPLFTLDPARAAAEAPATVTRHLFAGLVEKKGDSGIVPDVADRWEIVDDGRTYIFHLRSDVRWSDGVPLTAFDFEFAWKRALAMKPPTPVANVDLLFDIRGARAYHLARNQEGAGGEERVGVVAADAHTLVVELEQPCAYFLTLADCGPLRAVPRHIVTAHPETWTEAAHIVCSGPFYLESWQPGERLVLVRNPHYHRAVTGNVNRVVLLDFQVRPEERERRQQRLYEAGEVDIVNHFRYVGDPLERQRFMREHVDEIIAWPGGYGITGIHFDLRLPHFADPRVRRAFAHAIDRDALMQILAHAGLDQYLIAADGGFVPPSIPGHSPGIALPFDPTKAQQLLASAGFPAGAGFPATTLVLSRTVVSNAIYACFARQWQEYLGVAVECRRVPWSEWLNVDHRDPPPLSWLDWAADYPDPDNFLRVCWRRQQPCWRHEQYDRLIETARGLLDQEQRLALYREADRLLIDDAFFLPLFYSRGTRILVKPWVKKYERLFWEDVIIEPH